MSPSNLVFHPAIVDLDTMHSCLRTCRNFPYNTLNPIQAAESNKEETRGEFSTHLQSCKCN
jgi:hypothetical protein